MRHKSKQEKLKPHYPVLFFSSLLMCLVLITTYLLSGAYSKFFTSAFGGDSARVARFSPDFTSDKVLDVDKTPGYNAEIDFSVQNYSDENPPETAMKYKIILKTTGNIPLTFTLLDGEGTTLPWDCDGTNYEYTDNSLVFGVGTKKTAQYKLQIKWPSDTKNAQFSGMTDAVYLSVEFEQID